MFAPLFLFLAGALGPLPSFSAIATNSVPAAFDGQYTHATSSNTLVEWKYFQLLANPVPGYPPATFSVLFFQGYAFQFGPRDPAAPEYYLEVSGVFRNGTGFFFIVPAENATITADGQQVTGTWGSVAQFKGAPDHSYTATFNAPQHGLVGTFSMVSRGRHHLNCNTTTDPSFSTAIPLGINLNSVEDILYNQIWWLTSVPRGQSHLDVVVKGTRLHFSGQAYHDGNKAPVPLNDIVDYWYSAVGQVGPYDVGFMYLVPINSAKIFTSGYLARDGVILQNECSARGLGAKDAISVTPYGAVKDTVTSQIVPLGLIAKYTLPGGDRFQFNFTSIRNTQIIDLPVYHRWAGSVEGGEVGKRSFKGPFAFEWLNTRLRVYTPPS